MDNALYSHILTEDQLKIQPQELSQTELGAIFGAPEVINDPPPI